MATLRDDRSIIAPKAPQPMVYSKRAVKVAGLHPNRQRVLATRRRVFAAVILSIPSSIVFVVTGLAPAYMSITPLVAFALYVGWVQNSRRNVVNAVTANSESSESSIASDADRHTAPDHSDRIQNRRSQRTHLLASFASIRRAATQKLLASEPELDTAQTPSWQPAQPAAATWAIPETVLPTYVSGPAATSVPRNIDTENGNWDGAAMVQAASAQRKQDLAEIVAELQVAAPTPIKFEDEFESTIELEIFKGA
ncbi:MAG: hypothetical protein RLZZ426_349 [Actinomycetota bacterium]